MVHRILQCLQLQGGDVHRVEMEQEKMQENITSIVSVSVVILGVSVLYQCLWIHVAGLES